jgi:hypothetical protein
MVGGMAQDCGVATQEETIRLLGGKKSWVVTKSVDKGAVFESLPTHGHAFGAGI